MSAEARKHPVVLRTVRQRVAVDAEHKSGQFFSARIQFRYLDLSQAAQSLREATTTNSALIGLPVSEAWKVADRYLADEHANEKDYCNSRIA